MGRTINSFGRGPGCAGLALSAAYIGYGACQTLKTGDPKPLHNAVVETAAGFGGAYAGAKLGAPVGVFFGPLGGGDRRDRGRLGGRVCRLGARS
jgi:hypothetical protein